MKHGKLSKYVIQPQDLYMNINMGLYRNIQQILSSVIDPYAVIYFVIKDRNFYETW